MTLEKCYETLGGDLAEVLARLKKEERIFRLIKKVPADSTMQELKDALDRQAYEEAFRCAHNLKGLCANLGLEDLRKSSGDLTECLRGNEPKEDPWPLLARVERDYAVAVTAIGKLEE